MKRKNKQRDNLLRRKREKQRIRGQTKSDHDHVFAASASDEPTTWEKIVSFLSRPVPETEKLDRREKNQRQGDR